MARNGDDDGPVTMRSERPERLRPADPAERETDAWLVRLSEAGQGAFAAARSAEAKAEEARKEASEARREVRALRRDWGPKWRKLQDTLDDQAEQLGKLAGDIADTKRQASSADLTAAAAKATAEETGRTHVAEVLARARKFDDLTIREKELAIERDRTRLAMRKEWTKLAVTVLGGLVTLALLILTSR